MRKNKIEDLIRQKAAKDVPDVLSSIKETPEYTRFMDDANMHQENPARLKRLAPLLASMTALFLFGIIMFAPGMPDDTPEIATSVQMEINPSFSIDLDSDDLVIELNAYNDDAEVLLQDQDDLIGKDLDTAIDRLIARSIELGYMSSENNDVLFTVSGEDGEKTEELKAHIEQKVPEVASRHGVMNASMMRSVAGPPGEGEIEEAREHGVGFMQMRLVNLILSETDTYTLEELTEKNVPELKAILEEQSIDQDNFEGPMPGPPNNDMGPGNGEGHDEDMEPGSNTDRGNNMGPGDDTVPNTPRN